MYVDFWSIAKKWQRMEEARAAEFIISCESTDCYATVQHFINSVPKANEKSLCDFYVDIDSKDLTQAKQSAIKVVDFITNNFSASPDIYFSGNKGFHVIIEHERFLKKDNFRNDWHLIFKYIISQLEINCVDISVYSCRRQIRLNNTLNSKSGLYKIGITEEELRTMSIGEIKLLAVNPRRLKTKTNFENNFSEFISKKTEEFESMKKNDSEENEQEYDFKEIPKCVESILNNGWDKSVGRNQTLIQLCCFFKGFYSIDKTKDILVDFVKRFTTAKTDTQIQERVLSTKSLVEYINENSYRFNCNGMRSIKATCNEKECSVKNEVHELHLSDTAKAAYNNKHISTKVMIAGKKSVPYIVPSEVKYFCTKADCDKQCIFSSKNSVKKTITYKDYEILKLISATDQQILKIIKSMSGTKCKELCVEYIKHVNIEEMYVIPMADRRNDSSGYVLRKVYSVGQYKIDENKHYLIQGIVVPHPKTQEGTVILKSASPLQDEISKFVLTDVIKNSLASFKLKENETVEEKISSIVSYLSDNITLIKGREDIILNILLTLHSPLALQVPWDNNQIRGWLEYLVIGDTGTGKSTMLEKIMDYVNLGTRVNAESTSRTGLTYKMEQGSSGNWFLVWGAWPLSDKQFIWIDEAAGISKEEYGQMTMARSSGVLEVKRAVTSETTCRVRAVLTSNAPNGKKIGDYPFGVNILADMFNIEDIRRFDLASFIKVGDVPIEDYTNCYSIKHKNTVPSEVLRYNVLFAWSLTPESIKFSEESIKEIINCSKELIEIYGDAISVPLISASDIKNKLARISASLAIMLNNTDENNNVIIEKKHVTYIKDMLIRFYNSRNAALDKSSKLMQTDKPLCNEEFSGIYKELKLRMKLTELEYKNVLKYLSRYEEISAYAVEIALDIESVEAKQVLHALMDLGLINLKGRNATKTQKLNNLLSIAYEKGYFKY